MQHRLNPLVEKMTASGIRAFNEKARKIEGMLFFTIGEPCFTTPEPVKKAGIEAILKDDTFYTQNQGSLAYRTAVSKYVKERYELNYSLDEVLSTVGTMEAITLALTIMVSPGDEVIIFTPCYPMYRSIIEGLGGVVVEINTEAEEFQISKSKLRAAITEKTKAILFTTPTNPTGVVLTPESIENIASILREHEIFAISDEVYREIIYDVDFRFKSLGEYDDLRDRVIVVSGFSKSHSMMGWRIGYMLATKELIEHLIKIHQYTVIAAPTISQTAAITALSTSNDYMLEHYTKNRNYTEARLKKMGFSFVEPMGAFYFFVSTKSFKMDGLTFCTNLLNYKVACVPGEYFGQGFEHYFRLSYACSFENLEKGLDQIQRYIETL